ncbi:odorant receptor 131-2-like [Gadus chalcogrammus]|uniref:odorant receptor 131-2-like n=1 Tax=Gadus chalcogrammus TaxID=1042646 RepID=UPI0024C4D0F0|nr:odorant receptor 131-2-like [Gadus chalcogrammus]
MATVPFVERRPCCLMNLSSNNITVVTASRSREGVYIAAAKNVIVVALFVSINYINGTLVHTFSKHQIFSMNPRYILFIHMVLNDMLQLTVSVLLFVLSYVFFSINACICCSLVTLAALTTQNTPLNLVCMATECFIAVSAAIIPDVLIALATEPLEYFLSRVFCVRDNIFPKLIEKVHVYNIVFLVLVWLILFYVYVKILVAAKGANADAKKARDTVLLHAFQLLLCMLTYIAPVLKRSLFLWFPTHYANALFVCYVVIQMFPRFLSPIVYGLRDKTFRQHLKRNMMFKKIKTKSVKPLHSLK